MAIDRQEAVTLTATAAVTGKTGDEAVSELTDAGLDEQNARHLMVTMFALHRTLAETTPGKDLTRELLLQQWQATETSSYPVGRDRLNAFPPASGLVVNDTTDAPSLPLPTLSGTDRDSTDERRRYPWQVLLLLTLGVGLVLGIWLLPMLTDLLFQPGTEGSRSAHPSSTPDVPEEDSTPAADRILHILLIGLTDDSAFGITMQQNMDYLRELLEQEIPKERMRFLIVKGSDCNPRNVLRVVRRLGQRSRPADTLFCYYSGHGAMDPDLAADDPSGGHFFQLNRNPGFFPFQVAHSDLLRNTLFNTLLAQPGRLKVLVSESCSTIDQAGTAVAVVKHLLQNGPTPLEQLLLFHRGYVDLNASSPGEYSWSTAGMGGWFTQAFRETATTTWYELTDASMEALRSAGVPEEVLAKLSDLKDKACDTTKFMIQVGDRLTPGEWGRYRELVCTHAARQPDDWPRFVRQVARKTNERFLQKKRAILLCPRNISGSELRAIKRQTAMTPKVFRLHVVKDRTIPRGPKRTIRRTFREFVVTAPS